MGYEVHITRNNEWWDDGVGGGISRDEWLRHVAADETMRLDNAAEVSTPGGQAIRYESDGLAVWTAYSCHDASGNQACFDFRDGRICVKNPDRVILRKMHQIASRLSAKVLGDEGEAYGPDGNVLPADNDDSQPPTKPWWRFW